MRVTISTDTFSRKRLDTSVRLIPQFLPIVRLTAPMFLFLLALIPTHTVAGQAAISAPTQPAKSWALDCAKNEEQLIEHPGSYLRYKLHEVDQKGDQLRDQIETPQGTVARLIERDGHPLTPEQDSGERARLNAMISSPADFARHVRHEQEGRKNGLDLLRLFPDAMLWSYTPGQPQFQQHSAGGPPLVVLDFKPDPKWSPPNLQSELLTGLQGRIWIDAATHRLVHLEATIFRPVNVGWGMLVHVYPGGTVTLDQTATGNERWIIRHVAQQFTLRALLVKSVREQATTDTWDYQTVTAMPYQEAIKLLLDTPLPQR
jgi:hypothetical protein